MGHVRGVYPFEAGGTEAPLPYAAGSSLSGRVSLPGRLCALSEPGPSFSIGAVSPKPYLNVRVVEGLLGDALARVGEARGGTEGAAQA